jgi:hypothetical protein
MIKLTSKRIKIEFDPVGLNVGELSEILDRLYELDKACGGLGLKLDNDGGGPESKIERHQT